MVRKGSKFKFIKKHLWILSCLLYIGASEALTFALSPLIAKQLGIDYRIGISIYSPILIAMGPLVLTIGYCADKHGHHNIPKILVTIAATNLVLASTALLMHCSEKFRNKLKFFETELTVNENGILVERSNKSEGVLESKKSFF